MSSSAIALVDFEPSQATKSDALRADPRARDNSFIHSNAAVNPRRLEPLRSPEPAAGAAPKVRGSKAVIISLQLALSTCANSFTTGLVTIGIVDIAADLHIAPSLVYWPVLAYNLTSSPLLVPFGATADVFGARRVNLLGSLICGAFVIACGLAQNGNELIAFRCLHGAGSALFLPTSMSIISTTLTTGKLRNIALASLGLSMITGYGLGLVLGGVFLDTIGWRFGFFLCGGAQAIFFLLGLWTIPSIPSESPDLSILEKLRQQLDWVGALMSLSCIGIISYVLAMIAEEASAISQPLNLTLLVLGTLLIPAFVFWMRHQAKHGRPALIPGSLWKGSFTSVCIVVTFANAEMQCMELLASLFFQNVQDLSPLQSSLRILPGLISAATINLVTGNIVHKLTVSWTLAVASVIAGVAPLLMALINPMLPYWYQAFPAQILYPICIDFVFVVSALVISDAFPARDQALAGAVFNTIANLGQSLGLALIAIITNAVTRASGESGANGLLDGYRAGFWAAFASMLATAVVSLWGLRKMGAVGVKRD